MKRKTEAEKTNGKGGRALDAIGAELTDAPESIDETYRAAMEAIAAIGGNVGEPIALAESLRVEAQNQKMVALENIINPLSASAIAYIDIRDGFSHLDQIAVAFGDALKKCAMEYPSIVCANPGGDPGCLQTARSAFSKLETIDRAIIDGLSVDAELDKIGDGFCFGWMEKYADEIESGKRHLSTILDGLDGFSNALYSLGKVATIGKVDRGDWVNGLIDSIDPGVSITLADGHRKIAISGKKQWQAINALYSTDHPNGWTDLKSIIGESTDLRALLKCSDGAKELARWIERKDKHYRFNAPDGNRLKK